MLLYLIRHGKTDAHLEKRRQSPDTPLGEYGKKQALLMAERLNLEKIDYLYSSNWPRAIQTAEFVAKHTNIKINIHPHLHEIEKNKVLDDVSEDSDINLRFQKERAENSNDFDWKFDGEGESVNEVINRSRKVIDFLFENHPNDSVAIVSHGRFIALLISLLVLGTNYDKASLIKLYIAITVNNTGISSLYIDPESHQCKIICLNDHSHLIGEEKDA